MKHEITMNELQTMYKKGITTFSKKDNSPRGCKTVSFNEIKIGDEIVIDNYFYEIIDILPDEENSIEYWISK